MKPKRFNGRRLKDALQFREKKVTELARETGICNQALFLYANEGNVSPYENIVKIARALRFPVDFFMGEDKCTVVTKNTYFRSREAATKKSRNAQRIKMEYVARIHEAMDLEK